MKKIFVILFLGCFILCGCVFEEKKDYSDYSFTDVSWVRDSGYDTETITFRSDGSFGYSCSCGNPVNDADLCETYSYDDETKEIKLDCFETTNETVTLIKIISYDENNLELDFDGEIRKFTKE